MHSFRHEVFKIQNYDINQNKRVDRDEVPGFLAQNAGSARIFQMNAIDVERDAISELFRWLDVDGDRRLSQNERQSAATRLALLDANDDDTLVAGETTTQPARDMMNRRRRRYTEQVATSLGEYTDLSPNQMREIAALKLALVGLAGFEDYYPSEISGGMRKRAGLARAMALDPDILFFDEPSAGLDPISASLLDELILELRESLGATIIVVTHELASIFAIGNNSVYLDPDKKTMTAAGDPKKLLEETEDPELRKFLTRGKG